MSFQGPKVGPGHQPIKAHFVCMTSLCEVGKKVQNFWFGPPLYKKLATALFIAVKLFIMLFTLFHFFIAWQFPLDSIDDIELETIYWTIAIPLVPSN